MVEASEAWTGSGSDGCMEKNYLSLFRMQKGCWGRRHSILQNEVFLKKNPRKNRSRHGYRIHVILSADCLGGRGSSRSRWAEGVNEALHIFTEGRKNMDKILEAFAVESSYSNH